MYYARSGDETIARAMVQRSGLVSIVYKESNRRRGITSVLDRLNEEELGQSLRPEQIRSKSAVLASRR